jgi:phosphoglycolate phosphatase
MLLVLDKDGTLLDMEQTWNNLAGLLVADLAAGKTAAYREELCLALGYDPNTGLLHSDAFFRRARRSEIRKLARFGQDLEGWFAQLNVDRVPYAAVAPLHALFARLRRDGHRLAVLTNDSRGATMAFLRQQDVLQYFDRIVCAEEGFPPKPSPLGFIHIAEELGYVPRDCAMVGDSMADIACGVSAAAGLVICVGPEHEAGKLRSMGAGAVVSSVAQLPDLLLSRAKVPPPPPRPSFPAACGDFSRGTPSLHTDRSEKCAELPAVVVERPTVVG